MPFLVDAPIDARTVIDEVVRSADGAVVTFEGVVRDHHAGRDVESILYEAYRPMAEKELAAVVERVAAEFPASRVALRHRLGRLAVGDVSVVIAASSAHRDAAFAACRRTIDLIKETVPIWKKERGPDGDEWVGWQGRS